MRDYTKIKAWQLSDDLLWGRPEGGDLKPEIEQGLQSAV